MLQRVKNVKDNINMLKKIFITPDLTRKQQEVDKKLRDNLKRLRADGEFTANIQGGKVVKKRGKHPGGDSLRTTKVNTCENHLGDHTSVNNVIIVQPSSSIENNGLVFVDRFIVQNSLNCFFVNARSLT